ncbi:MAG TPA: large conductance mechanosensitive channel protein MscL [Thermoplasmata archaeon]|nr:large conductance mechanosensitive channel protein MscL [Thermoplasmata archaeon]HYB77903.1 large conductance mechanosensitive channel protein MscL [Thermoplasmata archaeon]
MSSIREEFGKFIARGNLVQLAVAFVMGAAFATLVAALVADIITPLIGVAGRFDFSSWNTSVNGSVFQQGAFLNSLISFITIALVVFFLIALPYQRYTDRKAAKAAAAAPTTRACPECLSTIPIGAKRCSFCTSTVPPVAATA